MKTRSVQIEDICLEPLTNGVSVPGASLGRGSKLVNIVDIYEHHIIDTVSLGRAVIPDRQLSKAKLKAGDVLFVRSSVKRAGAAMCSMFPGDAEDVAFGCFNIRLRPDPKFVDSKFLTFFLRSPAGRRRLLARCNTSTITNISQDGLGSVEVPLPDLSEQRRIAGELERADGLRRTRRYALELADTFLPAAFLQLFGDPVRNTKGWPVQILSEVAEVQGGIQLSAKRNELPLKKPYLRVANVQRGFLDLSEIKQIGLTEAEFKRTVLQNDDLLLVEGNGNPSEVGRAGRWDGSIPECVHQNHLIRVRSNHGEILPAFLIALLNSERGMDYYLKHGRTTSGLVTISTGLVNDFPTLVPPHPLQTRFAELVERHERLRSVQRESLRQAEHLFLSLLSHAFITGQSSRT